MTTWAIIDPQTGSYKTADSVEERDRVLGETAWQFYLSQTYNSPCYEITEEPDGGQSFQAVSLDLLPRPLG